MFVIIASKGAAGVTGAVLVATWTGQLDRDQLSAALSGESPFDEARMIDEHADAREPAAVASHRRPRPDEVFLPCRDAVR